MAILANVSAAAQSGSADSSSQGSLYGQTYPGVLNGTPLYLNNSFPFNEYATTSQILALPAVSSWLTANGLTVSSLRPFLTLWPSQGNPYDFSQMTVTENGTTFHDYMYLVTNSTSSEVIGIWVEWNSNSLSSSTVAKIYTFDPYPDLSFSPASSVGGADNILNLKQQN